MSESHSQVNYDIIISGGGTAGMAAAIQGAMLGQRVLVFDAAGPDYDKPCGEGLMPPALACLKKLGIELSDFYELEGVEYVLAGPSKKSIRAKFSEARGAGIRRVLLRRAMWKRAVELGVTVKHEPVRSIVSERHTVIVNEIPGSYCIVAEGLHSQTVKSLGLLKNRLKKNRFGLRQHFQIVPWSHFVEVWWGPHFEVYVTPVSASTINIAVLSDRPIAINDAVRAFPELANKIDMNLATDSVGGAGPLLHRTKKRVVGRILIAGDAAGFVDAMTGEGNTLALGSGMAASYVISEGCLWMYPWLWGRVVWRYWILTRFAAMVAVRPRWRAGILQLIRLMPNVVQRGLDFLVAT